jgi:microcin C transport system substrate-binding protein
LLEPFRDKLAPAVFDEPYLPPESDGSGSDRKLLKQAYDLLLAAGCTRDGPTLRLPNGKPLTIEFLDSNSALQPHTMPFIQNLGKLGIQANLRIVDPAQLKSRTETFDFDVVTEALGSSTTPGADLRVVYTSAAAAQNGSRNFSGVADPAVDALVETIATAQSRDGLNAACRALDRVLRAGHYWVPMFYRDTAWVAYWDAFSRPERQPKLGTGAPGTWWWDEAKAKAIGL